MVFREINLNYDVMKQDLQVRIDNCNAAGLLTTVAEIEKDVYKRQAIKLEKGQRINLEKETGAKLTNFCVGCNWGAIIKKTFFGLSTSVVDLSLIHIFSNLRAGNHTNLSPSACIPRISSPCCI